MLWAKTVKETKGTIKACEDKLVRISAIADRLVRHQHIADGYLREDLHQIIRSWGAARQLDYFHYHLPSSNCSSPVRRVRSYSVRQVRANSWKLFCACKLQAAREVLQSHCTTSSDILRIIERDSDKSWTSDCLDMLYIREWKGKLGVHVVHRKHSPSCNGAKLVLKTERIRLSCFLRFL